MLKIYLNIFVKIILQGSNIMVSIDNYYKQRLKFSIFSNGFLIQMNVLEVPCFTFNIFLFQL